MEDLQSSSLKIQNDTVLLVTDTPINTTPWDENVLLTQVMQNAGICPNDLNIHHVQHSQNPQMDATEGQGSIPC